jgi:hypothetical protein
MKFSAVILFTLAAFAVGAEERGAPKRSLSGDRGGQARFNKDSEAAQQRRRQRANDEMRRKLQTQPRGH